MTVNLSQRIKVFEALVKLYAKRLYYVSVRTIARGANVPISTASTELGILEAAGIVVRRGKRGGWRPVYRYERTYRHLVDICSRNRNATTIQLVADFQAVSYWTARLHLHALKNAGLVVQFDGKWKPSRYEESSPAAGLVIDVLHQLFVEDFSYVQTVEIARRLDVSARHVRNVLRDYEEVGQVERRGLRGGWRPAYLERGLSAEL